MIVEKASSPQESSPTKIIAEGLDNVEAKEFELAILCLKISTEVRTSTCAGHEAIKDRGFEVEAKVHEVRGWGRGGAQGGR